MGVDFQLRTKPSISIIICTYDRHELLIKTLSSLSELTSLHDYQVVIVENSLEQAKRQRTSQYCTENFPHFIVVESNIPGLSHARNIGLAHASSDIVAYLDDDARPCREWAESLIAAFDDQSVLYAGGPIEPDWEVTPPDWLPEDVYGAFTVLDLGSNDRLLKRDEFVYGANMAFRADPLRRIGGFNEQLGRVKANLHGEEDIAVQRILSISGQGYYASRARVKHFVAKDRLNWYWLIKRFAWQGFSEFSQQSQMQNFHRRAIDDIGENEFSTQFYTGLLAEPRSKQDALARLNMIRAVFGCLMQGQDKLDQIKPPSTLTYKTVETSSPLHTTSASSIKHIRYALNSQKPIFVEFGQSHAYLMKSFGDIGCFEFLNPQIDAWKNEFKANAILEELHREQNSERYRIFFLTLDWLLFNKRAIEMMENMPTAGLLHRIYDNPISITNLKHLLTITKVACFSKDVSDWVYSLTGIRCPILPHPPLFFKNAPSNSIPGRRAQKASLRKTKKWNLTLLGEIRTGKGFDRIIESLGSSDFIRNNVVLNLGGGGSQDKVNEIMSLASSVRLNVNLCIKTYQKNDFRGLDDTEFSDLIEESDIMLFPYHGEEAHSMSGHFVDSVFAGCQLLVSDQCAMAPLTEEFKLGRLFDLSNDQSICAEIERMIRRTDEPTDEREAAHRFQNQFSTQSCVDQLANIMKL